MNLSSRLKLRYSLLLIWLWLTGQGLFSAPFETIPFQLVGEHIFIKVLTETSDTLDFVFDTGASTMVVNENLVWQKGWKFDQRTTSTGVSGSSTLLFGKVNELNFGKVKFKEIQGVSAPLSHLELRIGKNIDGIIGYELLNQFIISIDYANEELRLFRSPESNDFNWGNGTKIGLEMGIPSIETDIFLPNGEKIKGRYFIDSGAGSALILNTPLVKKHKIESKIDYGYLDQTKGLSNTSATTVETEIQKMDFCGFEIKSIPTRLSRSTLGVTAMKNYAGIIGNQILKRFTLTFDYANKKMYVLKNQGNDQHFNHNISGLKIRLNQNKNLLLVDQVIDGSPAALAGIKVMDVLYAVNEEIIDPSDIHEVRKLLYTPDQQIQLGFIRGNQKFNTSLSLKYWFR